MGNSYCCYDRMPEKKPPKEKEFISADSLRGCCPSRWKVWQQEHEPASPITSAVRKWREGRKYSLLHKPQNPPPVVLFPPIRFHLQKVQPLPKKLGNICSNVSLRGTVHIPTTGTNNGLNAFQLGQPCPYSKCITRTQPNR